MNDESRLKECTRSIANAVHNNEAEVLKVFEFTLRKLHHMFFGNWVLFFFVNFLARCWDVFCAVTMLSLCWSVFVIFGPCNEVLGMLHIVWNYPMRKILSI